MVIIWCENLGAGSLAPNSVFHARTKYIGVDVHFIRDLVSRKELEVRYIPMEDPWRICSPKSSLKLAYTISAQDYALPMKTPIQLTRVCDCKQYSQHPSSTTTQQDRAIHTQPRVEHTL